MKKRILVVDDEVAICKMLEKFLRKKDFDVVTANSGPDAIERVRQERPHVVLLDIRMPGMDGVETLKKIREFDQDVGIIMITAVKEDETGKACMKLGAYGYITKPLDLDYLENCLMLKLLDMTAG